MTPFLVCVIGKKNSGKTTLTVGLVQELVRRGRRVMTVKHGHGFQLDREGSDSWRHREEGGAERVLVAGPEDLAILGGWGPEGELELGELVSRYLGEAEIVVAEGYKAGPHPKIEAYRAAAHADPWYTADHPHADSFLAVVTDRDDFTADVPVVPMDAPDLYGRLADLVEGRIVVPE
jgi:molybdopterin-guanine dinucleotide biosynthesis protein B